MKFIKLAILVGVLAMPLSAQNLIGWISTGAGPQLSTIDPTDGSVSFIGGGPVVGTTVGLQGITAIDTAANRFFFIGIPSMSTASIYTANLATGALSDGPHTLSQTNLMGIRYDQTDDVLYGMFIVAAGNRQAGTIDPTTGAVTLLGSPLGSIATNFGGVAIDEANSLLFFRGLVGTWNLYRVSQGAGTQTNVALNPDPGNFLGWAYDAGETTLFALYNPGSNRQLGTVNVSTGAVTDIGSAIAVASSPAITAFDADGNRYFFIATPTVGNLSIFTVNTGTGAATSQELPVGTNVITMEYDPGSLPVELTSYEVY
ncbi:MAG: hypothetical protein KDC35_01510 [Acidobacteria bacterium]|nr:hypothetical protein [Acidobacteriota bacterium]